jgi:NDP-sugar pyrophosphorylase family protein
LQIEEISAAILAGGLATRLRPVTEKIPKALVELAGKPFIQHQLDLLRRNRIHRVVFCLGYKGEMIESHLGNGSRLGMELKYTYDGERLLGTGGALRRAAHLLGDVFWVMYGDSLMDIDYARVLTDFASRNVLGMMTVLRNDNRWDRSNVVFRDGQLLRYDKKTQTPEMQYIDYGVALLRREALLRVPENEPYDLANLYGQLVAEGHMAGHEVTNRFYEIGTPESLEEARKYLEQCVRAGCGSPKGSS